METIRKILHDNSYRGFHIFHDILAIVILLSTLLVVIETVPETAARYARFFWYADIMVVIFFGIEYFLRILTDKKPLGYAFSPIGIVDMLAILPSIVLLFVPLASPAVKILRIIRAIRILRLLRVIRLTRFFGGRRGDKARMERAEDLLPFINLEIYFFALFIIVIFSASLLYIFERSIPGTAFATIPDGLWWSITTVTTVGYGDMVPATLGGRIVASATMLSGFALLALLLTVIGPALQVLLFGSRITHPSGVGESEK